MVDISQETPEETEQRLLRVIRSAELWVLDGPFGFSEFDVAEFPAAVRPDALALIRDEDRWSQLAPNAHGDGEAFAIFSFHFPDRSDNSGFVGWLATHLKRRFGTGVFVVCGHNASRGGVYDYWGCPMALADDIIAEIRRLNGKAGRQRRYSEALGSDHQRCSTDKGRAGRRDFR